MNQTEMKTRPVFSLLCRLSLPMVLSMLVSSLYNIVDSFFIAKIGENALSALSLVFPVQNFINAVAIGFSVGVNAVISRYLGMQEIRKAQHAASMGLLLNLIHGLLMMVCFFFAIPWFLHLFTSDPVVIDLGVRYSRVCFLFTIFITLGMTYEKIYQALGKMTVAMLCVMSGCIANILLDPLLIFGFGPIPAMGIEGAALATGIGQLINFLLYPLIGWLRPLPLKLSWKTLSFSPRKIGRLYAIGIPATLNMALPSVLISALNSILAGCSQAAVVVLGIYYKLQTFLYLPANGIIQGMRPLIGYNYGAGEAKRVRQIFLITLGMISAIMLAGILLCQSIPDQLFSLFSGQPQTIALGSQALSIISLGFVLSSISVTCSGALEGLGMGLPSLMVTSCRYLFVILPAALLLSHFLGAEGVWWSFPISEAITALFAWIIFQRSVRHLKTEARPDTALNQNKAVR